jgi:hypothetical protein
VKLLATDPCSVILPTRNGRNESGSCCPRGLSAEILAVMLRQIDRLNDASLLAGRRSRARGPIVP